MEIKDDMNQKISELATRELALKWEANFESQPERYLWADNFLIVNGISRPTDEVVDLFEAALIKRLGRTA